MRYNRARTNRRAGRAATCLLASLGWLRGADLFPSYNSQSIVNAATQTPGALAPNALATIYGTNLAFNTLSASVAAGATLPVTLDGVTVYVNGLFGHLLFVSPTQINFLIPYELTPGTVLVTVARQGISGPSVPVQLNSTAPGLFPWNGNYAIAAHLSGAVVSAAAPAAGGEIIVLYAAGLGRVSPDSASGRLATSAAAVVAAAQPQVLLGGAPLPATSILYAGLAPGFAGLYQINLRLPDVLPGNPEIRLAAGGQTSPPLIQLATQSSLFPPPLQ